MTAPLVGVLGAGGAVGRAVASGLGGGGPRGNGLEPGHGREPGYRLRLGGRDPRRTAELTARITAGITAGIGPPAQTVVVDAADPERLAEFCQGCDVVVNCAGPSRSIGATVARAAQEAGAGYVDAGGDEQLRHQMAGAGPAVLAAGLSPGLSGLLPRWLAGRLGEPARRLRAWCGGLERFTPAAAADMVASLGSAPGGHGESMAAWRAGAPASHALTALHDAVVPPFPGRVSAYPYLSLETQRVAGELGLVEVDWYHVIAGRQTLATLNELRTTGDRSARDCLQAGTRLVAAAELDLAGLRPYQVMVLELQGASRSQTLTLRAADGYRLTAAVVVAAVDAVLNGSVPAGAHQAADVLDPDDVVARLTASDAVTVLQVTPGPAGAAVEEGVL